MSLVVRIECYDDHDLLVQIYEIPATAIEDAVGEGELQAAVSQTVYSGGKVVISSRTYH